MHAGFTAKRSFFHWHVLFLLAFRRTIYTMQKWGFRNVVYKTSHSTEFGANWNLNSQAVSPQNLSHNKGFSNLCWFSKHDWNQMSKQERRPIYDKKSNKTCLFLYSLLITDNVNTMGLLTRCFPREKKKETVAEFKNSIQKDETMCPGIL